LPPLTVQTLPLVSTIWVAGGIVVPLAEALNEEPPLLDEPLLEADPELEPVRDPELEPVLEPLLEVEPELELAVCTPDSQLELVPPVLPEQNQSQLDPLPTTTEGVPVAQRLVVGALVSNVPLDEPHVPFTAAGLPLRGSPLT
jgi:hypothetical protein